MAKSPKHTEYTQEKHTQYVQEKLLEAKSNLSRLSAEKDKVILALSSAAFAYAVSMLIDLKSKGVETQALEDSILLIFAAIILHLFSVFFEMGHGLFEVVRWELIWGKISNIPSIKSEAKKWLESKVFRILEFHDKVFFTNLCAAFSPISVVLIVLGLCKFYVFITEVKFPL